jgi:hypothetical protein
MKMSIVQSVERNYQMRSNKELNDYEFIASNNIKRAMISLFDGNHNDVEKYLGDALECMYKINK